MKVIDSSLPPKIENPSLIRRILNRFFYETMSGNGACPVYLERWTLLELFGYGIYLHHFLGDDWALDPHDHPRRFISIGLKGWYYEDVFRMAHSLDPARDVLQIGDEFALPHDRDQWYKLSVLPPGETFKNGLLYRRPATQQTLRFQAPWIRSFPADHLHRVRAAECGNTWTLVIVLRKSRPWGFVRDGLWIPFKKYVFGGQARKAC